MRQSRQGFEQFASMVARSGADWRHRPSGSDVAVAGTGAW